MSTTYYFLLWLNSPSGHWRPHCWGFGITLRHITLGTTPTHERSARRIDLYLTTHNTREIHPCRRRDSKPISQQASGRTATS